MKITFSSLHAYADFVKALADAEVREMTLAELKEWASGQHHGEAFLMPDPAADGGSWWDCMMEDDPDAPDGLIVSGYENQDWGDDDEAVYVCLDEETLFGYEDYHGRVVRIQIVGEETTHD